MIADVKFSSITTIDMIRKFIPNLNWDSLDNMTFEGKQGRIVIYK